jgi:hypothetical protein
MWDERDYARDAERRRQSDAVNEEWTQKYKAERASWSS